jgi:hypothetical protein
MIGTGFILKVGARHFEVRLISGRGSLTVTGHGPVVAGGTAP